MHHVIILGCGRSGTSIFGEFFQHIQGYDYHSEPPFEKMKKWNYHLPVAVKVPKESPGFTPTAGLSFPLDTLLEIVPDPKRIYWQIRHPLDAICSLKVGISQDWGHHPKPPDWRGWLSRPLVERCAHHWNYLNTVGFKQVGHLSTLTRFEEMIDDPHTFAVNICEQTKICTVDHEDSIGTWAQRVQNTNNKHFIEAETSRPYSRNDHSVRVGRWQENMTEEERELVLPIIGETASQFGYAL